MAEARLNAPPGDQFHVSLRREEHYKFIVDFQLPGVPAITVDEPPPLGAADGPGATRLLAAAIGECLASSLLFCLDRARVAVHGFDVSVSGATARNEAGRLRVSHIDVILRPEVAGSDVPRMRRCVDVFEDYCTISATIKDAVHLTVDVEPIIRAT